MRRIFLSFVIAGSMLASLACESNASQFAPLFTITKISGDVTVSPPEGDGFEKAGEGKSYSYGTKIKTGRNSSAVVVLSEGNEFRILANASLTLNEDTSDKKLKSVKLTTGKVEVSLEEGFQQFDAFNVETPTAICGALECLFYVETGNEDEFDLYASEFGCDDGHIGVFGPNYEIPLLDKGDRVSVSSSRDGNTTRIRCLAGLFEVKVKDVDSNPRTIEMRTDMVIKIFRQPSLVDDTILIYIILCDEQGREIESYSYTETAEPVDLPPMEERTRPDPRREGADGGDLITTTTTTTSTTTTTTTPRPQRTQLTGRTTTTTTSTRRTTTSTVQSATPVGLR